MTTVLLTGGTGTLGSVLHEKLEQRGRSVRILSRKPRPDSVEPARWATADLYRNEGVDAAVDGVEVIVHCATGMHDVDSSRHLIDAAQRAGTRPHLVYISIVGIDDIPMFYYRAKRAVEDLVASAELPWTILRATQFHDLVYQAFHVQRWSPVLAAPRFSFQPIDVRDVADCLAEIAGQPAAGRAPDIGGPEVRSAQDLARAYLAAAGKRRPVVGFGFPGKTFAGYRAGHNTVPSNPVGTIGFEQFLSERA